MKSLSYWNCMKPHFIELWCLVISVAHVLKIEYSTVWFLNMSMGCSVLQWIVCSKTSFCAKAALCLFTKSVHAHCCCKLELVVLLPTFTHRVSPLGQGRSQAFDHSSLEKAILLQRTNTQRVQEMHILIGHIICDIVEKES